MGVDSIVVPNGVKFDAIIARRKRINGNFKVIQISRLDIDTKGQNIAIDAIKILVDKSISTIKLDFIGEGPSFELLKRKVANFRLNSYIRFLGPKDRKYIYERLKDYDLLIQPSFSEGFGLTIVEAMAAKVPVLVSDIEGPMEIIERGKYGAYFEKGSALDLANKIEWFIYATENQISEITESAYNHAKSLYNIQNTALKYLEEYKKV
jgi:glycosyltransferase involved in cell wall biosynthesis